MTWQLYRYVWNVSGRDHVFLSLLAIIVFLLDLVPLELQRRIVNSAVDFQGFEPIMMLCLVYAGIALLHGLLKLVLNVYRGSVAESTSRRLRQQTNALAIARAQDEKDEGAAISIVVSEVDAVGGFVGKCFSEPILHGGLLLSIFCYMLVIQPWIAVVALLLFSPQFLFIPLLQQAINHRTELRIKTLRALSNDIVDEAAARKGERDESTYRRRINHVYRLNMQIYRRKYGMNFLMNLFHHLGIVGILAVGGWMVMNGATEIGTVVAFISGLNRMNDPWGDLVDYFRDLTNAGVKFRLISSMLERYGNADEATTSEASGTSDRTPRKAVAAAGSR